MGLVGDLLERAARATPAAVEERSSGWWFRYTDNSTWWSGAVLAHGPADGLTHRIEAAERFYAERDAVTRFQICADCPATLDRSLAGRGYRWAAPISVLTADADAVPGDAAPGMSVRADASPTPVWLRVLSATSDPGSDAEHETRLLRRVDRPQTYLTVLADGEPVGIARAVADDGWAGVFNMATAPHARRRGVGRLALSAVARWAVGQDTPPRLYLQVEESNAAARRLYEATGFTPLGTYHYRVG